MGRLWLEFGFVHGFSVPAQQGGYRNRVKPGRPKPLILSAESGAYTRTAVRKKDDPDRK
jgi:hypothetical protein